MNMNCESTWWISTDGEITFSFFPISSSRHLNKILSAFSLHLQVSKLLHRTKVSIKPVPRAGEDYDQILGER